MVLSKNKSDWYQCSTETEARNIRLILEYSFENYSDYKNKTTELLGYEPVTTYEIEDTPYLESFSGLKLFNFIVNDLKETGTENEKELREIAVLEEDVLQGADVKSIAKKSEFRFSELRIETEKDVASYMRKIRFRISEGSGDKCKKEIKKRAEASDGNFVEESSGEFYVEFIADSEEELLKKTMIILETNVRIEQKKHYFSRDKIRLGVTECIDVKHLLEEEGTFIYYLTLAEKYEEVSSIFSINDENQSGYAVNENTISYTGQEGVITYYYNNDFFFDKISLITDLSIQIGKIERKIEFGLDIDIADDYHQVIKESLKGKLARGDLLKIYDKDGLRYYEVTFSSWFEQDINDFTNRILQNGESDLVIQKSIIPLVPSKIIDRFDLQASEYLVKDGKVNVIYLLPENTKDGAVIQLNSSLEYNEEINFSCFYYIQVLLYLVFVFWIISGVCVGVEVIREKIDKKTKTILQKNKKYCPICGHKRKGNSRFCGQCGRRFYYDKK